MCKEIVTVVLWNRAKYTRAFGTGEKDKKEIYEMKRAMSVTVSLYPKEIAKLERICNERNLKVSQAIRWCISLGYARMLELGALPEAAKELEMVKEDEKKPLRERLEMIERAKPVL